MQAIIGVIFGVILTYAFLEHDYQPPEVFGAVQKIQAFPEQILASAYIDSVQTSLPQKQRALAVLIKHDAGYFQRLDSSCDHCLTRAAIARVGERKLQLLEGYRRAVESRLDLDKHQALKAYLQRKYQSDDTEVIKRAMLVEQMRSDPVTYQALKKLYPTLSDDQIAAQLLNTDN